MNNNTKVNSAQPRRSPRVERLLQNEREKKRKREAELASTSNKKQKPSHGNVHQVVVTSNNFFRQRREVNKTLTQYRRLLGAHRHHHCCHDGIFHAKRRGRAGEPPFQHVPSPLSRELRLGAPEGPSSLWGSVKGFLWNVWSAG
ncbi:hypothetical protein N7535_003513 [Penicillium sp. DV-2018c]|nr:hypothetical protein N7461_000785 [Penicillium sp. DV-2018c]KAJ5576587.1 hypothetical protein N7535_003513 [Penicillium sp. DV-2018c]